MIGALVFVNILFYGVVYSGMSSFSGDNIGVLAALRGGLSLTPTATPSGPTELGGSRLRVGKPGMSRGRMRP